MRALLVASLLCAAAFAGQWVDLFQPPYGQGPSIMMAIDCVDDTHCYVAGGSNGVGFGVYAFNGKPNGQFTMLNMPDPNLMDMALTVAGTAAAPQGVTGGMGFGSSVEYFINATTLMPSQVPEIFFVTQDARTDAMLGNNVLVVDNVNNAALFSTNGGQSFSVSLIKNIPLPAQIEARYGSILSSTTWYVTLGNWPESNSNSQSGSTSSSTSTSGSASGSSGSSSFSQAHKRQSRLTRGEVSARVSVSSDRNGHKARVSKSMLDRVAAAAAPNGGYSAAIVKTTNGGQSWQLLLSQQTNFYFNGIDCLNATWCVAVGEGFDQGAAGHVFLTTNGVNFTEIFTMMSTSNAVYSFMSVRFATAYEVWIGGSVQGNGGSSGIFMQSLDSGKTWQTPMTLPYIADVTDMNFLPDGTGFAAAVTIFQDSTLVKYYNGPLATLAPGSPGSVVVNQTVCLDAQCSLLCSTHQFPTMTCLQAGQGQSVMLNCTGNSLVQTFYQSASCTGAGQMSTQALNTCTKDSQGTYFTDACGPAPVAVAAAKRRPKFHF